MVAAVITRNQLATDEQRERTTSRKEGDAQYYDAIFISIVNYTGFDSIKPGVVSPFTFS